MKTKYAIVEPASMLHAHPFARNKFGCTQSNVPGEGVIALIANSDGMGAMVLGHIYDKRMAKRILNMLQPAARKAKGGSRNG